MSREEVEALAERLRLRAEQLRQEGRHEKADRLIERRAALLESMEPFQGHISRELLLSDGFGGSGE